jgi:hypothetical protein
MIRQAGGRQPGPSGLSVICWQTIDDLLVIKFTIGAELEGKEAGTRD